MNMTGAARAFWTAACISLCAVFSMSAQGARNPRDAADSLFAKPADQAERQELRAALAALSEQPVVAGDFTQTKRLKKLGRELVSSGQFIVSAKDGVWWNIISPLPSTIIMRADRFIERKANGKESSFDVSKNPAFKRFAGMLNATFSGDVDLLEKEFELYWSRASSGWRLGLVPRDKGLRAFIASMEMRGDTALEGLVLREAGGDSIEYAFVTRSRADSLSADERKLFF